MPDKKPNPIISALSAVTDKIADWIERIINWLINTRFIKWLAVRAEWIRRFLRMAHLVRFSFWISVLGSVALFATSQSAEILRVIAEDSEHRLLLFTVSVLSLSLMSWYWARALIYRFAPDALDRPKLEPEAIAARWLPRVCGLIPFVGIGYALWHAREGLDPQGIGYLWLTRLFQLNLIEGLLVGVALHFRHKIAKRLKPRFTTLWPEKVKSKEQAATKLTDLPAITWVVLLATLLFSIALFILFITSKGQLEAAGWFAPASLVLLSVAAWIAFGSFFVTYFGKLIRLPILTPLLLLALLFSYLDWNDNHPIRSIDQPIKSAPQDLNTAFEKWWGSRADKAEYNNRPYPVIIVTAEGGGITTAYLTATVLTAIQDQAPAFAQHVFAISGVSGGSIGSAVYAGLAKRCTKNVATDALPGQGQRRPYGVNGKDIGDLQKSADRVLKDDYLSPLLAGLLYPDLVQKFLPFPVNSWDRARSLEQKLETSWTTNAACDGEHPEGGNELSQPFYDFFANFPNDSVPAIFFNTTNVETGERMFVTNLNPPKESFNHLAGLYEVANLLNPPFSTAACLSGRFPLITPSGYLRGSSCGPKLRYVDGGYYENSGTATGYNILMSLPWEKGTLYDTLVRLKNTNGPRPILPIIIRIGFPLPKSRNAADQIYQTTAEERSKYKGTGFEILSPAKTLLNTRGARGNDAVRQIETAIMNLSQQDKEDCSRACVLDFVLDEEKVKLPLGWMLSESSRCEIQKQVGSVSRSCQPIVKTETDLNSNQKHLESIISLLVKKQ